MGYSINEHKLTCKLSTTDLLGGEMVRVFERGSIALSRTELFPLAKIYQSSRIDGHPGKGDTIFSLRLGVFTPRRLTS